MYSLLKTIIKAVICHSTAALILISPLVWAEGSKDLTKNGGARAFLEYRDDSLAGVSRKSIIYAYAEVGETLQVASSALGIGGGQIQYFAPDNSSGSLTSGCAILNPVEEITQSYIPCDIPVTATGIWVIHFVSPDSSSSGNPPSSLLVSNNWVQAPTDNFVAAWDVTVLKSGSPVSGRVFSNFLALNIAAYFQPLNAETYIKTGDGVLYRMNLNGLEPFAVIFFANNKGFKDSSGKGLYRSIQFTGAGDFGTFPSGYSVHNPGAADTATDVTHKIFFNYPDPNMPASAPTPGSGSLWLNPTYTSPQGPSDVTFSGEEETAGQAGVSPLTGKFRFTSTGSISSYAIKIDVNNNGTFGDGTDRTLVGEAQSGINEVIWDLLDGANQPIPPNEAGYRATIEFHYGEVHFPFFDAESNPNGFKFERLDPAVGGDTSIIYYDNSYNPLQTYTLCALGETPVPAEGCYGNQLDTRKALQGIDSSGGANRWSDDFGNKRGLDVWGYVITPPVELGSKIVVKQADLQIAQTAGVAENNVTYQIVVTNAGPSAVTAHVMDTFPSAMSAVTWNCAVTGGSCATSSGTGNNLSTAVTLNNAAKATFTVKGQINGGITLLNTARVERPLDVYDPDLTNNETTLTFETVDLAVTAMTSSTEVELDKPVDMTFHVTNQGKNPASAIQLEAVLPSDFTLSTSNASQGVYSSNGWNLGDLAVGDSATLVLSGSFSEDGIKSFSLRIFTNNPVDSDLRNNQGSVGVRVLPAEVELSMGVIGEGTGTVSSLPAGISCSNSGSVPCDMRYLKYKNVEVTLVATADAGSAFSHWTGNSDCMDGKVTMDRNLQCYGHFTLAPVKETPPPEVTPLSAVDLGSDVDSEIKFVLTVSVVGHGQLTTTPAGIQCGDGISKNSQCEQTYTSGETVTLTATPDANWELTHWEGDCATSPTLGMTAAKNCQVTFVPASSTLTSTDSTGEEKMTDALTLLRLTLGIKGQGRVTSGISGIDCGTDCREDYAPETHVELVTHPDAEQKFVAWSGDCQGSEPTLVVEMTTPVDCIATFEPISVESSDPIDLVEEKTGQPPATEVPVSVDTNVVTETPVVTENSTEKSADVQDVAECPPQSELSSACNAQNIVITQDLHIGTYGNLSNAVLQGTVENEGWVANVTLEANSRLHGGIVTGSIFNAGVLADFEFRGGSIQGGTLAGTIINLNRLGKALFKDVHLAAGTHIRGGYLSGEIVGEASAPALLDDLVVEAGSFLDYVIIGKNVKLANNVTLGTHVQFLESSPETVENNEIKQPSVVVPPPAEIKSPEMTAPVKPIYLSPGIFISGETLVGYFVGNEDTPARLAKVTIEAGSQVHHVQVGDEVVNAGILADVEFQGRLLQGGTLAGTLVNTMGGTIRDVQLAADTQLHGGNLAGRIVGHADAPAVLENVSVASGSYLENVIISSGVQLPRDVILGPGVQFLQAPLVEGIDVTSKEPLNGGAVAVGTDALGQPIISQARFTATLYSAQESKTNGALFSLAEARSLILATTVTVDPRHVYQPANLFVIAKVQLSPTEIFYYMKVADQWLLWDKNINHLQSEREFAQLPAETFEVKIFAGDLSQLQGEFTVFVGYSLADGNLTYNGVDPLHFFVDKAPASCIVYAVNDEGLNDTQMLKIDLGENLEGVMVPLGPTYYGRDIEGLAMHPTRLDVIYGSSSYHANVNKEKLRGYLYTINRRSGDLTLIGPTGFEEVSGLAVSPVDKTLWGWARNESIKDQEWTGIIKIDPETGVGTAVKKFDFTIQDMSGLAASPDGKRLYATSGTTLWVYEIETQDLKVACERIDKAEVEGIDMQPNGLLLLGADRPGAITFLAYDPKTCTVVNQRTFSNLAFDDIESLVWPAKECSDQSWLSVAQP